MGCVADLKPVDVEPCCVPLEKPDVPFRDCGTVDDGCGGVIDFGICAHDAAKVQKAAEELVVQAQEDAKTVKLEERRLVNLEEELEELKEEAQIVQQQAAEQAPAQTDTPPGTETPAIPETPAEVQIEQEIAAKIEEIKASETKIEVVGKETAAKVEAAQQIQHQAKKAISNRPCSREKPCAKGVKGCIADDECSSGFCWHFYTGKGHRKHGLEALANTCWDCESYNAQNGCGTTASCPCE